MDTTLPPVGEPVGPALPIGTQVVLREPLDDLVGTRAQRGATGTVTSLAGGRYEVTLSDGRRLLARRDELNLRKAYQSTLALQLDPVTDPHLLVTEHTVYAAVVGSRAFGLDDDASDTDVRAVYVAPTDLFWSLSKPPPHVTGPGEEWFSWEVERFCELALKANPNLLEVLHSPLPLTVGPLGAELLDLRRAFLSQLVYQTYHGYVLSQFRKLEADLRRDGAPRWKHVMHLIRLLMSARDLLRTGELHLDAGTERDRLLAIKRGELSWETVDRLRLALHGELDEALPRTPLPAAPDTQRVDDWLRSVRARCIRPITSTGPAGERR
jgi:uncharacterized protein